MNQYPFISVIMPVYNGEKRIHKCLGSIKKQSYPQDKIEIIIVDDDSTDNTVQIAKEQFGAKIVRNGTHDPERGKSIGIEHAAGEYLFFIDDDNILTHRTWLENLICAVVEENCVGGQAAWFAYRKKSSLPDKYMELYGCGDPAIFYLHRRDHMMKTEKTWHLGGEVLKQTKKYFKIKFDSKSLPTIGSQGFLIKKEYVHLIKWQPFFYHIDSNLELIKQGYDNYIIMKDTVVHNHSVNYKDFMAKIKRNAAQLGRDDQYRTYSYDLTLPKMIRLGLTLGTMLIPFVDSIRGFIKFPTLAWFLHPIVCFRVALAYTGNVLKNSGAVKKIK